MIAWDNWATGVLAGVSAPASAVNLISLWNWSNKESGADVMRWNNPLNTTMPGWGGVDENSVGVKKYPSVVDGIQATVVTLLNGRYPQLVANLRNQVPHSGWGNAAQELVTWGTGTNWLGWTLQPPNIPNPGGITVHISERWALIRLSYATYEARAVEDGNLTNKEIEGWAQQIDDAGSNADAVVQAFIDGSKKAGNYKLGAPAGNFAPVKHSHSVSVTGSGTAA